MIQLRKYLFVTWREGKSWVLFASTWKKCIQRIRCPPHSIEKAWEHEESDFWRQDQVSHSPAWSFWVGAWEGRQSRIFSSNVLGFVLVTVKCHHLIYWSKELLFPSLEKSLYHTYCPQPHPGKCPPNINQFVYYFMIEDIRKDWSN